MSIQFEIQDTVVRITVAEVDPLTVAQFAAELAEGLRRYEEVPRPSPGRCMTALVVDLSDVRFLDSTGIRALVDCDIAALQFGGRVVVTGARGIVRRCLEVTGVLDRLRHPAHAPTGEV
jgi:anti-anti-sigma factor